MNFFSRHVSRIFSTLCLLLLLCNTAEAQDDPANNPQFGIIEAYEAPDAATALGVGWTRVRFQWAEIQPDSAEQWQMERLSESHIASEAAAGRQLIGLLIGIPDWARDANNLPSGLYLPIDHPDNLWAVFVRTAVARYRDQIDHWIIWNEPDIWDKNALGHTWDGTEADFAQLMRVAYLVAKETNPDAVIHLASMTWFWDANAGREQYMARLMRALQADPEAAAHNHYFDVATAHLYFHPQQMYDILDAWRAILAAHGIGGKPFWLVETNAPVVDDPSWPVESVTFNVPQRDQARFVPQAIALAFAAGAERISIFKLIDTESDRLANPEPFGLLRADGSPRPGFTAYQVAIELLRDVVSGERERWDDVAQIRLDHADGRTTHVLFMRKGQATTAAVEARAAQALLVGHMGERELVSAENGRFFIPLKPPECNQPVADYCMIGGDTFYLIQQPLSTPTPNVTSTSVPVTTVARLMTTPTAVPTPTLAATAVVESGSGDAGNRPNYQPFVAAAILLLLAAGGMGGAWWLRR